MFLPCDCAFQNKSTISGVATASVIIFSDAICSFLFIILALKKRTAMKIKNIYNEADAHFQSVSINTEQLKTVFQNHQHPSYSFLMTF